jgi:hypothetical protein|uniref:Uncharacterized protein n=1 Tax=viral metagenome TaxID=1070528 RepID=A0A6C0E1I8_9ZZZZ
MLSSIPLGGHIAIYTPTTVPKTSVLLKPVKHRMGNMNYVAVADPDSTERGMSIREFMTKYDPADSKAPEDDDDAHDKKKERNLFSLGEDGINTFYIGSITVVGLFILYRFINKSP